MDAKTLLKLDAKKVLKTKCLKIEARILVAKKDAKNAKSVSTFFVYEIMKVTNFNM